MSVRYDSNGRDLIDDLGNRATVYDTERYSAMATVLDLQNSAVRENLQAATNYKTALANVQIIVDAGKPHDVTPAKPLKKVVSDTGDITFVPFVPALSDLVPLAAGSGSGLIAVPSVDKQAIMFNMIQALFWRAFPDA